MTCKWQFLKCKLFYKEINFLIKNKKNNSHLQPFCSASKIFEKLIIKQIHYFESTNKLDLTGKRQHGLKKLKSTATAGTLLQSIIARAGDNKCYAVMASLDLTMTWLILIY